MDFLILIKNGCDNLTATVSLRSIAGTPYGAVASDDHAGLVWRAGSPCLRARRPGFSMAKFLNFFMLITFAYCFVKFYDGSIPGIGYSFKGFISGGTSSLVDYIGNDSTQEVQNTIHTALGKVGNHVPSFTEPYTLLCTYTVQIVLSILDRSYRGHHRLRRNRSNDHRTAGPRLHSLDGLRQDRIPILGMAQGISRLRVLQGRGCRNDERHEPSALSPI